MGFSFFGLIIVILIIIPNIIYMLKFPPKNVPRNLIEPNIIYTILERTGQIGCLTLLVITPDNFQFKSSILLISLIMICIVIYYGLWIRYIVKGQQYMYLWKPFYIIPIPLAILPIIIFLIVSILNKSILISLVTIIFAIGHITISLNNYKQVMYLE